MARKKPSAVLCGAQPLVLDHPFHDSLYTLNSKNYYSTLFCELFPSWGALFTMSYAFSSPAAQFQGPRGPRSNDRQSYASASSQSLVGGAAAMGYRPSFEERAASPSGQYLIPPSPGLSTPGGSESMVRVFVCAHAKCFGSRLTLG